MPIKAVPPGNRCTANRLSSDTENAFAYQPLLLCPEELDCLIYFNNIRHPRSRRKMAGLNCKSHGFIGYWLYFGILYFR